MYFREYAPKVFMRSGNMLPAAEAEALPGFSSIYAFSQEHADIIKASGCSKGLNKFPVYSENMVFDLDDGGRALPTIVDWCRARGLSYSVYESGSKGLHVLIPHEPLYDKDVPYTHKLLAQSITDEYDPTLYQHGRLFRNVGTTHEKTGRKKCLVEHVEGDNLLSITIRNAPETKFNIKDVDDEELLPFVFSRVAHLINNSPGCGRRYRTFWQIARDAYRCGISFDTTLELCLLMNSTWKDESKDEQYVKDSVEKGYN